MTEIGKWRNYNGYQYRLDIRYGYVDKFYSPAIQHPDDEVITCYPEFEVRKEATAFARAVINAKVEGGDAYKQVLDQLGFYDAEVDNDCTVPE